MVRPLKFLNPGLREHISPPHPLLRLRAQRGHHLENNKTIRNPIQTPICPVQRRGERRKISRHLTRKDVVVSGNFFLFSFSPPKYFYSPGFHCTLFRARLILLHSSNNAVWPINHPRFGVLLLHVCVRIFSVFRAHAVSTCVEWSKKKKYANNDGETSLMVPLDVRQRLNCIQNKTYGIL